MSFPHPPDFTGFPIASHNPFGKFPPGSLLRPPLPIVESGPSRDKTPRAQPTGASAGGLALVPGARSHPPRCPSSLGGAGHGAGRRGGETPAAPARRRRRRRRPRFERTETPAPAPDGPAPPLPKSRDEIRAPEPDDIGNKTIGGRRASGPQAGPSHPRGVARSQRSCPRQSRFWTAHADCDRTVVVAKTALRDPGRGVTLLFGSGRKGRSWNDVSQSGHRPGTDTRIRERTPLAPRT